MNRHRLSYYRRPSNDRLKNLAGYMIYSYPLSDNWFRNIGYNTVKFMYESGENDYNRSQKYGNSYIYDFTTVESAMRRCHRGYIYDNIKEVVEDRQRRYSLSSIRLNSMGIDPKDNYVDHLSPLEKIQLLEAIKQKDS